MICIKASTLATLGMTLISAFVTNPGLVMAQGPVNPYQEELALLKELACEYNDYKNTPVAIENLVLTELGLRLMHSPRQALIPGLEVEGLIIGLPQGLGHFKQAMVAPIPTKDSLQQTLISLYDLDHQGRKIPLLASAVVSNPTIGLCELADVQTWDHNLQGQTLARHYYNSSGKHLKSYYFQRPALELDAIFPEYGECIEDLVYPDLKTAQAVAQTKKLVKMAIVDSGVDYNHPVLAPLIDRQQVQQNTLIPDDEVDQAGMFIFGPKGFSHGTAVAFAATQFDGRIQLLPYMANVRRDYWPLSATVAEALKRKPDIINMSLSTNLPEEGVALRKLIEANPDVLFVVAAGNDQLWLDDPRVALYPSKLDLSNVLTVASTNAQGDLSSFTNYGAYQVEIAYVGENVLLPLTQSSFFPMTGTSFSAPLVANMAAQMKMANPALKGADLKRGLMASAKPLPMTERWKVRAGIADPKAAVAWASAQAAAQ